MKTRHYISFLLGLLLGIGTLAAQNSNKLYIPDLTALPGSTLSVPVYVENTTEIVAVQFILQVPEGSTLTPATAALTNRAADHTVTLRGAGAQEYLCVIYSPTNSPLKGRTGKLMTVDMQVGSSYGEGSTHEFMLKDVVLSLRDGSNVLSSVEAGTLTISKCPDLCVKNVKADKTTCAPSETLGVSWQVENIGGVETGDGWSEQISLVQTDGTSILLGTTHYDETISPSGSVSRQATVTLPQVMGLDGSAKVQVQIISRAGTGENEGARGNNTATTAQTVNISKQLTLTLPTGSIAETYTQPIRCTLTRSGNRKQEQTFTLTATADSRLTIPQNVVIPAGQSAASFYIQVKDNTTLDSSGLITVTASGNGYAAVSGQVTIEDNEYPDLTLTASKSQITEGESFQLTVTLSRPSATPLEVTLTSENSKRFTFPSKVTIPDGETSATIDVVAIDNNDIELQESIAFRASAEKYERGECIIVLDDNDMPTLTFSLSPETVSEADGYAALFCVIKRTDNLDKRVTIKLSDDSNGLLTYPNQTIVMAKNQAEVQFNIGVIDNDLVDGDHVVNVNAAVYASSCNCSASNDTKGFMAATVTIIDDDGPTLKIKPAGTAMLEGSENNVFTISHNTQSNTDVRIRISSDKDDILEYDHELTIPAGQTTANLLVNVKSNDQQDDSNIATFKVEADGYAMGTCWILITDQTLPDAIVSLYADKTEAEAEQTVLLHAVVKNVGHAPLRSTTPVEISFSGRKETVDLKVGKSVAVGDSVVIEYNYDLPAITGSYSFMATVNAAGKVPELIYANNASERVEIKLLSPFSVTAKADKDVYQQGESVSITGKAIGSAGKNAQIEVYIINEGSRQTITSTSDEEGNYSVVWKPQSKLFGHFIIGACYPGSNMRDEMDAFDVYGIKASDNFKTCELNQTEIVSGKIIISNPGILAQTGLTLSQKAESENCEFTFNVPNAIGAGEFVEIDYTIKGNAVSEGRDWKQMPIEISTAEGSHLDYTIYYYVHPLKAKLVTNETYINTTMTFGTPREYSIVVKNVGKAETGKITLALPSWIQSVTSGEMASLAQGDSATIVLRFIPTDAMKLNVKVSGRIGINCANGDGTAISFDLTPVSEAKGKLKVDVVDEYTFYTEEAPHVSNAQVRLKNPSTNAIVAEGVTASDGTFSFEVPEGYYYLTVDADKHNSYSNTVIIDPGIEKKEEVFLSYQTITYSWNVEETEIDDEYEIETIVKYETRVPKPVVIISLPDEQPEPYSIIPVVVTNKGMANAVDVDMSLSISEGYKLEFLNDLTLEVLAPEQSYVFYAKMIPDVKEEGAGVKPFKANDKNPKCFILVGKAKYKQLCQKYTSEEMAEVFKEYKRHCQSSGSGGSSSSGGSSGGSSRPGHGPGQGGNYNYDDNYKIWDTDDPAKFCDKVLNEDEEPITREIVPDLSPEEIECDKEAVLVYKLVPTKGRRFDMLGVAADGVSQVKLVLDGRTSKIPKEDCGNLIFYKWELSPNIGTIEGNSISEAIYTAPDNYPEKTGSSTSVQATLWYSQEISGTLWIRQSTPVTIEIIRPPVVFVHGLGSTQECWEKMDNLLVRDGLYKDHINHRIDYSGTNTSSFDTNYKKIGVGIHKVQHMAKQEGYVAKKCDLVGHSMGGILSRLYVQNGGDQNEVNRIITVNTPHAGSEFGDAVVAHKVTLGELAKLKYWNRNIDAIYDLAVESPAINNLNAGTSDISLPVYALATESDLTLPLVLGVGIGADVAGGKLIKTKNPFGAFLGIICKYVSHVVTDDISQIGFGDLIVSTESQKGGCDGNNVIQHGPWHINSTDNDDVMNFVRKLLVSTPNDGLFSYNWFKPSKRSFVHDENWVTDMVVDIIRDELPIEIKSSETQIFVKGTGDVVETVFDEIDATNNSLIRSSGNRTATNQKILNPTLTL